MAKTIWFTGLPCSGKTTIAKALKDKYSLFLFHLDGDIVRKGLCEDLKFSEQDRYENVRRVSHLSQMINENGIDVVSSFISPTEEIRLVPKKIITNMILVYVKCSINICIERDVKGMWKKAIGGKIKNFTGYDSPFEEPVSPDLILDTSILTINSCVNKIIEKI